jgi:hypothetical protein
MTLFIISFHDIDEELGGCIMRGSSEQEVLARITKADFGGQVGLPAHGRLLISEIRPKPAALIPDRFIDRLLTGDEIDQVYELIKPASSIPEGPALEATTRLMNAQLNEDIARDLGKFGK